MKNWLYILVLVSLFSCKKDIVEPDVVSNEETVQDLIKIPNGFPAVDAAVLESITPAKVALGKKLFFDPVLSRTGQISCGSCHKRNMAFTDGQAVSEGVAGLLGKRSSPSLVNLAWAKELMWIGGPKSLEAQVVLPFNDHNEFDLDRAEAIKKLTAIPEYIELFNDAFKEAPTAVNMAEAIAMFERTIVSGNSNFDKFEYGGNQSALSDLALKGKSLFNSDKFQCSSCHTPPLFTNYEFINNGIFTLEQDPGRFLATLHTPDMGKFKVPTLRNIEVTAPYMHDGRFKTLEEVIDFYGSGGGGTITQDQRISKKDISQEEKEALIAFLKSLTDLEFLSTR